MKIMFELRERRVEFLGRKVLDKFKVLLQAGHFGKHYNLESSELLTAFQLQNKF